MRTRFAPSPTGSLHLGHAYSAMLAHDLAQISGGEFLLRIEDIDQSRARPEWVAGIERDLHWLGLRWWKPVIKQSDRMPAYRAALERLWALGLLYPCHCRRRDIEAALSAPQEGHPAIGPDGIVYPGTCRPAVPQGGSMPEGNVLRLDMARALTLIDPERLRFRETGEGGRREIRLSPASLLAEVGDVILARTGMGTSYHLSVVVDDAESDITHVARGADLFEATAIHVVLQALLDLPTPLYHHHRLIRDEAGRRLAKRDDARAISVYREAGASPDDIRAMVGLADQSIGAMSSRSASPVTDV